jgi:hypothetical protein
MSTPTTIKYRRRGRGSYIADVKGQRVAIVNMKGDGPNAPAWRGPVPSWEVRVGGHGEHDIGSKTVHTAWTLAEARQYVERGAPVANVQPNR